MGDLRAFAQRVAKRLLVRAISVERGDDRVLHRSRAAQASVRQLLDPGEQIVEPRRCAATAIQPARHPGARYAFDSDENVMIGASGLSAARAATGPSKFRSRVNLVREQREVVLLREIDEGAPGAQSE